MPVRSLEGRMLPSRDVADALSALYRPFKFIDAI